MNNESLRVTYVGQVARKADVLDEPPSRRFTSFDSEAEDRAFAVGEVPLRCLAVAVARQAGIVDPVDLGMSSEELCNRLCILTVSRHAQVERLDSLQGQKRSERTHGSAGVA